MKFLVVLLTLAVSAFAAAPTVSTPAASAPVNGATTLSVKVLTNGATTNVTFLYGIGTDRSLKKLVSLSDVATEQTAKASLAGLAGGQTYHFKVEVANEDGAASLDGVDFAVPQYPPTIMAKPAVGTLGGKETLRALVAGNGYDTAVVFKYGETTSYTVTVAAVPAVVAATESVAKIVEAKLEGLNRGQSYHFIATASYTDAVGAKTISTTDGIFVARPNQAPKLTGETVVLRSHSAILIDVLSNDSDPEKDGISLSSVSQGKQGATTIEGGKVRYTPKSDAAGPDTFTYTVTDDFLAAPASATATVTIKSPGLAAQGLHSAEIKDEHGNIVGQLRLLGTEGGAVSGKVELFGKSFPLLGMLDADGNMHISVPRPGDNALSMDLAFDQGATSSLKATINDGNTNFSAAAPLAAISASRREELQGRYTVQIPGAGGTGNSLPQGTGYVRLDVQASGDVSILGRLGDGQKFRARGVLGGLDDTAAVNVWLAPKDARVSGTFTFSKGASPTVTGSLDWLHPTRSGAELFPDGFITTVTASGGLYTAPEKGARALKGGDDATLTFTNGNLPAAITHTLDLNSRDKVEILNPSGDGVTMKIDRGAGIFSGKFVHPVDGSTQVFNGVLLQQQGLGRGVFRGQDQTGTVEFKLVAPTTTTTSPVAPAAPASGGTGGRGNTGGTGTTTGSGNTGGAVFNIGGSTGSVRIGP